MATLTITDKARQGRLIALASLENRTQRTENAASIFDFAFDEPTAANSPEAPSSHVVSFRSTRETALQPQSAQENADNIPLAA